MRSLRLIFLAGPDNVEVGSGERILVPSPGKHRPSCLGRTCSTGRGVRMASLVGIEPGVYANLWLPALRLCEQVRSFARIQWSAVWRSAVQAAGS